MSNTVGMSDGGRPHLQPYPRKQDRALAGPFSVQVAAVLSRRIEGFPKEGLQVGLLTRSPGPEGAGYEELSGAGYARQPLQFTGLSAQHEANAEPVSFGPIAVDWRNVTHLGVFDAGGELVGYGPLIPMGYRYEAGHICFDTAAIRFKRHRR